MTPKADTRDELLRSLSGTLVALVSGNWDSLEIQLGDDTLGAEHENLGWREVALGFFGVLRTTLVGVLRPLLLFIAYHFKLTEGVSTETLGWVKIGVFIWTAFILMLTLDPLMKDKITAFKDIVSIFRSGSKKE